MASTTLPSGCSVCGKQEGLLRCSGCKVMLYCGQDHQAAHRPEHKSICKVIKVHRHATEEEEQRLRNHPGDRLFMPADPFTNGVGYFWGMFETRHYMRLRFAMVEKLAEVKTVESVQAQLDHLMDMLRLCRSDNMGVRDYVPALMLRLNKDQECYDFMKWWTVISDDDHYDWGDTELPYLDIKNADVFEPVDPFLGQFRGLASNVPLILLKIKLLFDLARLEESAASLSTKRNVPREIVDQIQSSIPQSPAVAANREMMDGGARLAAIKKLKTQIDTLYNEINKTNKHFWPALMNPHRHLTAKPEAFSAGSVEEMQLVLKNNYAAWIETPGALDFVKAKFNAR